MASAHVCGGVHRKMMTNSTTADQLMLLVTAAHPTRIGAAPAAPPMTTFLLLERFSQML
jgi:hypothetical protein